MHKKCLPWVLVGILVLLFSSVYAGKPGGGTPPPCTGAPIEVLIQSSCGMSKWIRVNDSASVCTILCKQYQKRGCPLIGWIGGTVVADAGAPDGWYFDPNTVIVAEVTAEGMQATLCAITNQLSIFAGGLWYVGYNAVQTRPAP